MLSLSEVRAVVVRNLELPVSATVQDTRLSLFTADGNHVLSTAVAPHTCNPSWQHLAVPDEHAHCTSFVVRVESVAPRGVSPRLPGRGRRRRRYRTLLQLPVSAHTLRPVEEVWTADGSTATAGAGAGGSGAGGGGGATGGAASAPTTPRYLLGTATPVTALQTLPANTLLLVTQHTVFHAPPDASSPFTYACTAPRRPPSRPASPPSSPSASPPPTSRPTPPSPSPAPAPTHPAAVGGSSVAAKHLPADATHPIHVLRGLPAWRDLAETWHGQQAASASLVELKANLKALHADRVAAQATSDACAAARRRIAALRARRDALRAGVDRVAATRDALHRTCAHRAQRLSGLRVTARALADAVTDEELSVVAVRDETKLVAELLAARRLSLVSELRLVYPILELEPDQLYAIRGAKLPAVPSMQSLEEEEVSTALGYVCHLVQLLSKYLEVPLRYQCDHMGSRSEMHDITTPSTSYPLFWKAADQKLFKLAVFMLQCDVQQLLTAAGAVAVDKEHMLKSLLRLNDHLLGGLALP